jgi:4-hydroxythreonine-4-phosphate dehydrogenase
MQAEIPRILLTTGDPAGIGPDLLVDISAAPCPAQLVCLTDPGLLAQRAKQLSRSLEFIAYDAGASVQPHRPGTLLYMPVAMAAAVVPGKPDKSNAGFVLECISMAARLCRDGDFDAMVTAPVNKGIINDAGHRFTGHTEFIAGLCGVDLTVMMLMNQTLRVALVTTHIPLAEVPRALTSQRLERTLEIVNSDLQARLAIREPVILVCGLNPHAGEAGYLGREEIEVITPVLRKLRSRGLNLNGPVPADTAFTPAMLRGVDVVVTMYHDQGLPVLKAQGFGATVNVTLGLPIIRTSVDHGTAMELAGTGKAKSDSLRAAIASAIEIARHSAKITRAA